MIEEEKIKEKPTKTISQHFFLLRWFLSGCVWGGTILCAYLLYVCHDLPSIDKLDSISKTRKVTILDNRDIVLATYGDIYGYYVDYRNIPRNLRNAVIATEDRKFFQHFGIDIWGIIRAAYINFRAGRTVQGGSTITQQLAKIVFLKPERNLKRKIQEALLAVELEMRYSKEQILAIYLNRVYLGAGLYGIDSAAKYYFGKNVQNLTLHESAIIAGLLKAPSKLAPTNNSEHTGHRAYQVLHNMLEEGYINKKQFDQALNSSVSLDTSLFGSVRKDYFTNWIYDHIDNYVPNNGQDITVKTTLDSYIQQISTETLSAQLNEIAEQRNVEQGAVVILDRVGQILAMVGGKDFKNSSFNRVTQATRQAGSAFKVFVYTAAMEKGFDPTDRFEDKKISYGSWSPQNFNKNYLGYMSLDNAFANSINTIAVQLADKVGINKVINVAKNMGIKSPLDQNLALALGASSVTLLEMTSAYSAIVNNGYTTEPYAIQTILDSNTGDTLYEQPEQEPVRVISTKAAEKMQYLLENAVAVGTSKRLKLPFRVGAKTGTSQDFRDAWFVGYTDKFLIGIWLGNDNYSPTKHVSGGTYPTLIARNILSKINDD